MSDKEMQGICIIDSSNGVRHLGPKNQFRKSSPLHRFCSTTSIRAIYRIYSNNEIYLKMFWVFYFGLCVAGVIVIGMSTMSRYLKLNTNTHVKREILRGNDYPSLTLCTNGFFGINEDTNRLVNHTTEYLHAVDELLNASLKNGTLHYISSLLLMKSTVFYNVNNLIIARNLTQKHMDASLNLERFVDYKGSDFVNKRGNIFCSINVGNVQVRCQISAYLDLKYRSCITAKISGISASLILGSIGNNRFGRPLTIVIDLTNDRYILSRSWEIPDSNTDCYRLPSGMIKDEHADLFVTRFMLLVQIHFPKRNNELMNDIMMKGRMGMGKFVDLNFHSRDSLPPMEYHYTINMDTDKVADVTFAPSYISRLSSAKSRCLNNETLFQNHTGTSYHLPPSMMILTYKRVQVRKHCHCEAYWPPLDRWPLKSEEMCGSLKRGVHQAVRDINCMYQFSYTFSGKFSEKVDDMQTIQQLCYQYHLTTSISISTIEKMSFLEYSVTAVIFFIAQEMSKKCHDNNFQGECAGLLKRYQTEVHLLNQIVTERYNFTNHSFPASSLWKSAFPEIKETMFNAQEHQHESRVLEVKFYPQSLYKKYYVEVLAHPFWSTISQLGGATSFVAGITFIVVGELLEIMIGSFVEFCKESKCRIRNAIRRRHSTV